MHQACGKYAFPKPKDSDFIRPPTLPGGFWECGSACGCAIESPLTHILPRVSRSDGMITVLNSCNLFAFSCLSRRKLVGGGHSP